MPDSYLALGSALNNKVANPFFGTAGGVLNLASSTVTQAQLLLPYPQFGAITLQSSDRNHALYNSIYIKAQKRLGHAIDLLTTYTWSRNEDASNAASNTFNAQQTTSQDNYNRAGRMGTGDHRYAIPLDHRCKLRATLRDQGQKFLAKNKLLDFAVGGWAVNFQTTMQSGFPLAIYQSNLNSVLGTSVQRPNATGLAIDQWRSVEQRLGGTISIRPHSHKPRSSLSGT